MYMIAWLCMLKIYQNRHPDINANAHTAYFVISLVIFLAVLGVVSHPKKEQIGRGHFEIRTRDESVNYRINITFCYVLMYVLGVVIHTGKRGRGHFEIHTRDMSQQNI